MPSLSSQTPPSFRITTDMMEPALSSIGTQPWRPTPKLPTRISLVKRQEGIGAESVLNAKARSRWKIELNGDRLSCIYGNHNMPNLFKKKVSRNVMFLLPQLEYSICGWKSLFLVGCFGSLRSCQSQSTHSFEVARLGWRSRADLTLQSWPEFHQSPQSCP
jgi:hypothetical protein